MAIEAIRNEVSRAKGPRKEVKKERKLGLKLNIQKTKIMASGPIISVQFSSVQFSRLVMSDSLRPHELQHARPPCPSPTPRGHSDSRS